MPDNAPAPDFAVRTLLDTASVTVRDVCCAGHCRHQSAEECASATELVFPYRGVFARHVGRDQTVAEANQVLFFNATEGYRVSHPVVGGDASLSLNIREPLLRELAPKALIHDGARLAFRRQRLRIDPRSQALVALRMSGQMAASDPAYQRGIGFLLRTQLSDGSWLVRTRAFPFQPYKESGYPHGKDQWISAAGSSWAAMALSLSSQTSGQEVSGF